MNTFPAALLRRIVDLVARAFGRSARRTKPAFHRIGKNVIVDQATMDYYQSTAPDPTQESLDGLLKTVTRIRIIAGGTYKGKALGKTVLLDTDDADAIASFRDSLRIVEDPGTFGHCRCYGDPAIELYKKRKKVATIGYHHGRSIRWEVWKHDAILKDGEQLVTWMAERGVTGPKKAVEAAKQRAEEAARNTARWRAATPACLVPLLEKQQDTPGMATFVPDKPASTPHQQGQPLGPYAPFIAALEADIPDLDERILALLHWFGNGAGPWSGYPSYEKIVEKLLPAFPTESIIAALDRHPLTPDHLEGAARYFGGWWFSKSKPDDLKTLPEALKARLLTHVLESGPDDDKRRRAERAFG